MEFEKEGTSEHDRKLNFRVDEKERKGEWTLFTLKLCGF